MRNTLRFFTLPAMAFVVVQGLTEHLMAQTETVSKQDTVSSAVFRFHMPSEPHTINPARLSSSDASYFLNNIMRGLYSYSNLKGLVPEDAEICRFESALKLVCRLRREAKWSDGSAIVAEDYVRAFRNLVAPTSKNPGFEILKNLKNAFEVYSGKKPHSELGAKAESDTKLVLEFDRPDPDFLFKLTTPLLVPVKNLDFQSREKMHLQPVNGPYKVTSWQIGRRLRLEANPHYSRGNSRRPPVEILFVDDDQTALHLYEKGELSFLRRLHTHYIPRYKSRADFLQIPVARFDYIGFGPDLSDAPDFRAALSHSADFKELARLLDALGTPGCPSLPEEFLKKPQCVEFDLKKAREHWAKVPDELKKRRWKYYFSKLGGDDHKKVGEWLQAQWKKNLGLILDLEQTEQGVYLAQLRTQAPSLFRKGIGLDRPTCLAAVENFGKDSPENFIQLRSDVFQKLLSRLSKATEQALSNSLSRKHLTPQMKSACSESVEYLTDHNLLIPLGRIHFTLLANIKFTGWELNEMNQLDLARLALKN